MAPTSKLSTRSLEGKGATRLPKPAAPPAGRKTLLQQKPTGKLGTLCKWEGPYRIKRRLTDTTYLLEAPVRGKLGKRRCNRQSLKRYFVRVAANQVISATADEEGIDKMRLHHGGDTSETEDVKLDKLELGSEITDEQKKELSALLKKYSDVFQDRPGKALVKPISISTGSNRPVTTYPYRTPNRWKDKIQDEIDTLLEAGIIEPSTSPWASPIVPVPKPGGDVRMCVDYRKLNKITETDIYPLPRVEKILEEVSASKYITTLDLSKGYYQFPIVPSDQKKTAFVTESGKWQFTRMPFGLKGAPAAFQREMDSLFQACPNILAYIDDVAIFSSSWSQHLKHLEMALNLFKHKCLTIKLAKSTAPNSTAVPATSDSTAAPGPTAIPNSATCPSPTTAPDSATCPGRTTSPDSATCPGRTTSPDSATCPGLAATPDSST